MTKVSAIITTHNRASLLKRAIESVLSQTYKDIECIVIDDASDDETEELCSHYPIKYVHIKKEESRGGNYARNLGIKKAIGKYVAFLDDDDYWLPLKIEKQVDLIEKENCDLVYCGRRLELIGDNSIDYKDEYPNPDLIGDMRKKILLTTATTTTAILVKKDALIEIGMFDENLRFWQEYELTIRLAQRSSFYAVNEILIVYRVDTRDKNRLTNKYSDWKKAVKYIYDKHNKLYFELDFLEKEQAKMLYVADASVRAANSGLDYISKYYKALIWTRFLPARILLKIKKTL